VAGVSGIWEFQSLTTCWPIREWKPLCRSLAPAPGPTRPMLSIRTLRDLSVSLRKDKLPSSRPP
jgi:hypothetical protein